MLKRLQVRDFKSLRELEVEFGRLTVLVGPNGCGKSSVLQAVKLVRDLALAEPTREGTPFVTGMVSQPAVGDTETESFQIGIENSRGFVLDSELRPDRQASPFNPSRLTCEWNKKTFSKKLIAADPEFEEPAPKWVFDELRGIELFQLDKRTMGQPSYSDEPDPLLGTQGENLATVLDALQGSKREQFEAIEAQLCHFIPGLQRVRLHRVKMPFIRTVIVNDAYRKVKDDVVGHQVVFDFGFARNVAADQASEGTILLLGLLTVISAEPERPMTIMLDDLDRALHPKAQRQLVEHLHDLLDQRPELQIIATSHSPYLVEHLAYEEVRAMTQSPVDGRSLIAPLTSHPDAERWREEMSAGEFWSNVGEAWIHQAEAQ